MKPPRTMSSPPNVAPRPPRGPQEAPQAHSTGAPEPSPLMIWVPCQLRNHANHGGHWTGKAGYQRALRDKTHVLARALDPIGHWPAKQPKCVTITAYVWNYFDEHDGLRNACKPIVDGLVRARVLHDDGPKAGHQILYTQVIDRTQRGVKITVGPR